MTKKIIVVKKSSRYSDENKVMLHRFMFNINEIIDGQCVTRILMQCL